ncbi:hypothetical protein BX600DRAFT_475776 [Xylariales sp. PMI_506]|nr:hypothetical protein BX600DRAFT_475776 [Xylariales sp. PMI_506]
MAEDSKPRPIRVGVVGAGIAGCCLTVGLLQNPLLDVHLFESYPDIRVRGSGLALHGNAMRAMDCISPKIKQAYFKKSHYMANEEDMEMATQFILASGEHAGTLVAELGKAKGRRSVHRAHFIEGLLEDESLRERLHFAKRLVSIAADDAETNTVTASFADGTTESFDLMFGAEGVKSPARRFILGADHPAADPVNYDEWRAFSRHVPMEEAKKVVSKESIDAVRCFCTPLGFINGIPVDLGQTFSITCYQRDNKSPVRGAAKFDPEQWKGFLPAVDALVSLLEKDAKEDWQLQDHDHATAYYKGQVAIIGDAAHATYPHAGNGAAQAIEDAAVLTSVFSALTSKKEITAALAAFDAVRRPRSQKVIDLTRLFAKLYSQDPGEIDLGSMRAQMKEGGMYMNSVDMQAQVQEAVDIFKATK